MSIGFSVDFTAHISYHYYRNPLSWSCDERLADALKCIGWPMVQAGISTLFCITPLSFIDSYMVRNSIHQWIRIIEYLGESIREDSSSRYWIGTSSWNNIPTRSSINSKYIHPDIWSLIFLLHRLVDLLLILQRQFIQSMEFLRLKRHSTTILHSNKGRNNRQSMSTSSL